MREIKLRAWFEDKQEMKSVAMNNVYEGNTSYMHLSPMPFGDYRLIKLMQYTGLKDKNGAEIYEGDIVACDVHYKEDYPKLKGDVRFRDCGFVVFSKEKGFQFPFEYEPQDEWEVIGNIYEDSHLLEGESNEVN